jgi:hypothetical protein
VPVRFLHYAISLPPLSLNLTCTSLILEQLSSVTLTFINSSHFKVPDVMSVFQCLHISKKSARSPKHCLITSNTFNFYGKNPKLKTHPYNICPLLLTQSIHSYLPYLVDFSSIVIPRTRHALLPGTRVHHRLAKWMKETFYVTSIRYPIT